MAQIRGETETADRITVIKQLEQFGTVRADEYTRWRNDVANLYKQKFKKVAAILDDDLAPKLNAKILEIQEVMTGIVTAAQTLREKAREQLNKKPPPNGKVKIEKKILEKNSAGMELIWDNLYGCAIELFNLNVRGLQSAIKSNNRDVAHKLSNKIENTTILGYMQELKRFIEEARTDLDTVINAPSV